MGKFTFGTITYISDFKTNKKCYDICVALRVFSKSYEWSI